MNYQQSSFVGRRIVETPDGLNIAVQEWGNPAGRPIIFIHGFSQCHLSWSRQYDSALAREFRLITYDLRGHGRSDKPLTPEFYREGHRWAGELDAVIELTQAEKPVLVAWSYGGRIVSDYLARFGAGALSGISLVGSKIKSAPAFLGAGIPALQQKMASDDLSDGIPATIAFLKACAETWDADTFSVHLAFNMLVPPEVRGLLHGRELDADAVFKDLNIPILVTHGTSDRITPHAAGEHIHAISTRSRLSLYEATGHCPFLEQPERFNAELADFVRNDCVV